MTQNDPVIEEINQALKRRNLRINYEISFPRYNIWPDDIRLALNILKQHGMKITIALQEVKQNKSE